MSGFLQRLGSFITGSPISSEPPVFPEKTKEPDYAVQKKLVRLPGLVEALMVRINDGKLHYLDPAHGIPPEYLTPGKVESMYRLNQDGLIYLQLAQAQEAGVIIPAAMASQLLHCLLTDGDWREIDDIDHLLTINGFFVAASMAREHQSDTPVHENEPLITGYMT